MRERADRDARLVETQVEAHISLVTQLMQNLQSVKHGDPPSIAVMRSMVMTAEAVLSLLLLIPGT